MNFNWEIYKLFNPDLVKKGLSTKFQLVDHFRRFGLKESRKYSIYQLYPDFNPDMYRYNYKDLEDLKEDELEIHWVVHGSKEGRTYYNRLQQQNEIQINKLETIKELDHHGYINKNHLVLAKEFVRNNEPLFVLFEGYHDILDKITKFNIYNKKVLLTIAESLYPPNGGGENWLLDMNQMFSKEYHCVGLCFKDVYNRRDFDKIELVKHNNMFIIQMPIVVRDIVEIIYRLKPITILHQGYHRLLICKIARLLGVNFVTGFCFWNDMIKMNMDHFNVNMIHRKYELEDHFQTILENSNSYLASDFMKTIIQKNNTNMPSTVIDNLSVIPTISSSAHYQTDFSHTRKYVCILNSHHLKGGQELLYLLNHLDINIPILSIMTERSDERFEYQIRQAFLNRNKRNNVNILFDKKQDNIREIYSLCRVLLIPSIVDETFCRVAYEGMALGLNIISYRTGNLAYLLSSYKNNTYIEIPKFVKNNQVGNVSIDKDTLQKWLVHTEKIYKSSSIEKLINVQKVEGDVKTKLMRKIQNPLKPMKRDTIGFYCPFVDQGLGIQCREYVTFLNKQGFKTAVFSFKPYRAVQVDKNEWNFSEVYYSNNNREEVIIEEIIDFVFNYNVKVIIIPEICYKPIYQKIDYFKCLGVKVVCVINIEILRYNELMYYHVFDMILANNVSSFDLLKQILPENKIRLLEFNNTYMPITKIQHPANEKLKIAVFGGFNSFIRKNIDKTYKVFKKLDTVPNLHYELNIYIQGNDETLPGIKLENSHRINIYKTNLPYYGIIHLIQQNDVIIHLGDHEGLGLGFFEALNNNKVLITLDTYPNKEFIVEGENGYLIGCGYEEMTDNDCGIINRAVVDVSDYYSKMLTILGDENSDQIRSMIERDKTIKNGYEERFIKIIKELME